MYDAIAITIRATMSRVFMLVTFTDGTVDEFDTAWVDMPDEHKEKYRELAMSAVQIAPYLGR